MSFSTPVHRFLTLCAMVLGLAGCQQVQLQPTGASLADSATLEAESLFPLSFTPVLPAESTGQGEKDFQLTFGVSPSIFSSEPRFTLVSDAMSKAVEVNVASSLSFAPLGLLAHRTAKPLLPLADSIGLEVTPKEAQIATVVPAWSSAARGSYIGNAEFLRKDVNSEALTASVLLYFDQPATVRGSMLRHGYEMEFAVDAPTAGFVWVVLEPIHESKLLVRHSALSTENLLLIWLPPNEA